MDHEENIWALGGRIGADIDIGQPCKDHDQECIHDTYTHDGILHVALHITACRSIPHRDDSVNHTDEK